MSTKKRRSGKSEDTKSSGCTVRVVLEILSPSLEGVVQRSLFKSNLTEKEEATIIKIVSGFFKTLEGLGLEHISPSGDLSNEDE
ncbi:MAG: hypothetical protein ACYSTI_14170 [Planctomycetota bacterium]